MSLQLTKRRGTPPLDRRALLRRARRLLAELGLSGCELSLLVCGDVEMRELNRAYRGLDRTTDVLAFSQAEGGAAGRRPEVLGDVVICLPQAARQAARRRAPVLDEVEVLLVHGLLHLLGHDHTGGDAGRAAAMRREQRRLLARLRAGGRG